MAEQKNVQEQDINQLIKVRRDKLKELQENGKDPFQITKYDVTNHSTDIKDDFDAFEGKEVSIAGRMMFKRVMGKASFCNVQDLINKDFRPATGLMQPSVFICGSFERTRTGGTDCNHPVSAFLCTVDFIRSFL